MAIASERECVEQGTLSGVECRNLKGEFTGSEGKGSALKER